MLLQLLHHVLVSFVLRAVCAVPAISIQYDGMYVCVLRIKNKYCSTNSREPM